MVTSHHCVVYPPTSRQSPLPPPFLTTTLPHPRHQHRPQDILHHLVGGSIVVWPQCPHLALLCQTGCLPGHPFRPTGHGSSHMTPYLGNLETITHHLPPPHWVVSNNTLPASLPTSHPLAAMEFHHLLSLPSVVHHLKKNITSSRVCVEGIKHGSLELSLNWEASQFSFYVVEIALWIIFASMSPPTM
jgi:hypothetical protein